MPPVSKAGAEAMRASLRAYPLLAGVRGAEAADVGGLAECIERISWLAVDLKDRTAELDINPLRVLPRGRGARVVDALVVLP